MYDDGTVNSFIVRLGGILLYLVCFDLLFYSACCRIESKLWSVE